MIKEQFFEKPYPGETDSTTLSNHNSYFLTDMFLNQPDSYMRAYRQPVFAVPLSLDFRFGCGAVRRKLPVSKVVLGNSTSNLYCTHTNITLTRHLIESCKVALPNSSFICISDTRQNG